jgi:hypothetical protein
MMHLRRFFVCFVISKGGRAAVPQQFLSPCRRRTIKKKKNKKPYHKVVERWLEGA